MRWKTEGKGRENAYPSFFPACWNELPTSSFKPALVLSHSHSFIPILSFPFLHSHSFFHSHSHSFILTLSFSLFHSHSFILTLSSHSFFLSFSLCFLFIPPCQFAIYLDLLHSPHVHPSSQRPSSPLYPKLPPSPSPPPPTLTPTAAVSTNVIQLFVDSCRNEDKNKRKKRKKKAKTLTTTSNQKEEQTSVRMTLFERFYPLFKFPSSSFPLSPIAGYCFNPCVSFHERHSRSSDVRFLSTSRSNIEPRR